MLRINHSIFTLNPSSNFRVHSVTFILILKLQQKMESKAAKTTLHK